MRGWVILGNRGPVAATFRLLGLGDMPQLLFTTFSSSLGMGQILLPYMILSLYSVMRRIEPNYIRAAEGLGARPFVAFRLIYLPLSLPGIVSGTILVFTLCLGFYVTPVLLGAPRDMMVAQLISQQVDELLNWGLAAALAIVLLAATVLVLAAYDRIFGLERLVGIVLDRLGGTLTAMVAVIVAVTLVAPTLIVRSDVVLNGGFHSSFRRRATGSVIIVLISAIPAGCCQRQIVLQLP